MKIGDDLIVGGSFQTADGDDSIERVARWDGTNWYAIDSGFSNGTVHALIKEISGSIIAGGDFTDRIKRWDGISWNTIGSGFSDGAVRALLEDNSGNIIAGGEFNSGEIFRLAKFEIGSWTTISSTYINNDVYALSKDHNGDIIIGGRFTNVNNDSSIDRIVKWDGNTTWSKMGGSNGINNIVYSLLQYETEIVAAGTFTTAGLYPVSRIASYDDDSNTWSSSITGGGSGMNDDVRCTIILPSITFPP